MKRITGALFLLVTITGFSQKEISFRVAKTHINLGITVDTLVQFEKYYFRLYGIINSQEISKIEFPGCQITFNDSFIEAYPVSPAKSTGLHIYSKKYGEVYRKQFTIVPAATVPKRPITSTWVKKKIGDIGWLASFPNFRNDTVSSADLEKSISQLLGNLIPISMGLESGRPINTSYVLSITSNGQTESFTTSGLQLKKNVVMKFKDLKAGAKVLVHDVSFQCTSKPADATVFGPYNFFIKE